MTTTTWVLAFLVPFAGLVGYLYGYKEPVKQSDPPSDEPADKPKLKEGDTVHISFGRGHPTLICNFDPETGEAVGKIEVRFQLDENHHVLNNHYNRIAFTAMHAASQQRD